MTISSQPGTLLCLDALLPGVSAQFGARTDLSWMREALCAADDIDPEVFFPHQGGEVEGARAICDTCPVSVECLAHGLDEPWGIWGGTVESQRRYIRRRLGRLRRRAAWRPRVKGQSR